VGCAISVNVWLPRRCSLASAPVEEHLRVYGECRERLAAWDEYVAAMRAAIPRYSRSPKEDEVTNPDA
jgi:anti-sigma factor RsiW